MWFEGIAHDKTLGADFRIEITTEFLVAQLYKPNNSIMLFNKHGGCYDAVCACRSI